MSETSYFWLLVGFTGQGLFTARFVVQWLASERTGEVVVPAAFWWLSILGAVVLLSYAISRLDPVFAAGQSFGLFIYARNLMLESRRKPARADDGPGPGSSTPAAPHFRAEAAARTVGPRS